MMAKKRSLEYVDSLIRSKMPRLEKELNLSGSPKLCKPNPLTTYAHETPLKYTGTYLAYHLRNPDGSDLPGLWSHPPQYLTHIGNPHIHPQPPSDCPQPNGHLYRVEPEGRPSTYESAASEKRKVDLVKDLMNVRLKWVTFVERQENLRKGQNAAVLLHSSPGDKHHLVPTSSSSLSPSRSCPAAHLQNVAVPQPIYRNGSCYPVNGCSLESPTDCYRRNGPENGDWRVLPPVNSSCLMAGDNQGLRQVHYSNLPPPRDNASLPSEAGSRHISSTGRPHKETRGMPQGYGAFSRNLLQDPRYPVLPYESADGSNHINPPTHSLQELQKISLQPYSLAEAARVQPPLYHDRSTPPKFPVLIQHKAVQGPNQPTGGHYSLQLPSYRLSVDYPASGGHVPVPTALFTSRHNPGSFPRFPDNIRYLPPHYHILPQESSAPGPPSSAPLIPPAYQLSDLERQAPSRTQAPHSSQRDECADNAKAPSGNVLRFSPRVIIDAQKDQQSHHNPPESLPNEDLVAGQCQLLSKHSAFHPVMSASHMKGAGERVTLPPGADRRTQEPAVQDPSLSACVPPRVDYDPSPLGKLRRELAKSKGSVRSALPLSYSVATTSRKVPDVCCSPAVEEEKFKPPGSPPMPIINNVFSLAPYQAYLEASGIFTKYQNCQSNQECTCSKEGKVSTSGDGTVDTHCERCSSASRELPSKIAGLPFEGARDPPDGMGKQSEAGDLVSVARCSTEFQRRALNFSVKHGSRLRSEGAPVNDERASPRQPGSECQCADLQLAAEKETEADTALDLSMRSKLRFVNAAWQSPALSSTFSSTSSPSAGATQEPTRPQPPAVPAETQEVATEFVSEAEQPKRQEPLPAELGEKNSDAASDDASNSSHSRAIQLQVGDVNLRKYKKLRPAQAKPDQPTPAPPAEKVPGTIKFHSVDLLVPLSLKLRPLKLLLTDMPKSALSHKQEPTTPPSETKVPAPDTGESVHSDSQGYFMELHQSLCNMVSQSVTETSEDVLRLCQRSVDAEESRSTENPRLQSLPKSKNRVGNYELLKMSKAKEIWLQHGSVQSTLQKLLAHLERYLFTQRCPFPHVIRAGTIFIPIYLIREKLFSNLEGAMIDRVFQEHKIELRPTTLSEEKKLQSELQLQRCSSRLIKLLSLKQLPDIYPDLLNVFWHSCLKAHLGEKVDEDLTEAVCPQAPGDPSEHDNINNINITLSDPPPGEIGTNPPSVSDDSSCLQNEQDVSNVASRLRVKGTKRRWKLAIPSSVHLKKLRVGCGPQSAREVKVHPEKPSCVWRNGHIPVEEEEDEMPQLSYRKLRKRKILLMAKDSGKPDCEKTGSDLSLTKPVTPNRGEREARDSNPVKVCRVSTRNRNNTNADSLRPTRSTSKVLHLRRSIVHLKFQRSHRKSTYWTAVQKPLVTRKTVPTSRKEPKALSDKHREVVYPNLVGKRIRHLYEESDKSESWYKGLVVRLHEKHPNPLKTVYEVKYDSEPEWQYYLELLHDYAKGWVRVEV